MHKIVEKIENFLQQETDIFSVQYLPSNPVENPDWKVDILLITDINKEHYQLVFREREKKIIGKGEKEV